MVALHTFFKIIAIISFMFDFLKDNDSISYFYWCHSGEYIYRIQRSHNIYSSYHQKIRRFLMYLWQLWALLQIFENKLENIADYWRPL